MKVARSRSFESVQNAFVQHQSPGGVCKASVPPDGAHSIGISVKPPPIFRDYASTKSLPFQSSSHAENLHT